MYKKTSEIFAYNLTAEEVMLNRNRCHLNRVHAYDFDNNELHHEKNSLYHMSPVKRICVFEHSVMTNAQPFRGARDLSFCLKVPLDSLLV